MSYIDKIYVINLEHRKDRLNGFMYQMEQMGMKDKVERIDAIYTPDFGILGCGKSHLLAIDKVINSEYKNVLICEDDFRFYDINNAKEYLKFINDTIDYDVISFSANENVHSFKIENSEYPFLHKGCGIQTASAYLLNKNFSQKLYNMMKEGVILLENTREIQLYANDIYWKNLQPISKWYLTNPKLGYQQASYSDIERMDVDYNC